MERVIQLQGASIETGNQVLDILLTSKSVQCVDKHILLNCMADGSLLRDMDAMDLCAIFGNALDNAIEYEEKIQDLQKRLIKLTVRQAGAFRLIRIANYCEEQLPIGEDLMETTKADTQQHGYGLKSIRSSAHKYKGKMTLRQEEDWVVLSVLLPAC